MSTRNVKSIIAGVVLLAPGGAALAAVSHQVRFDLKADLQNVFIYADEFNGDVYAWDLFPKPLGNLTAGTSMFDLGSHNLRAWAILATSGPAGAAPGINSSLGTPPDGLPFETVFPGYPQSTVQSNISTLYTGGAFNTTQAWYLTEFVLAVEDTLKTDFPTGTLKIYTFENGGLDVGTATFSIVPEPGAVVLVLAGLAVQALRRHRDT